jgi:hypothetical protein
MSERTNEQLRNETRIGFKAELGNPWWGNGHFDGAVPIEEARKLLAVKVGQYEIRIEREDSDSLIQEILEAPSLSVAQNLARVLAESRKSAPDTSRFRGIVNDDDGHVFQVATTRWSHEGHAYEQLLEYLAMLVDESSGHLMIGSVICLDHKQKAMVQIRPPEGVTVGGDKLLPFLTGFSSLDSSWSTGFKAAVQRAVCDNTAEMVMRERTGTYRKKHTTNSRFNISDAREIVGVFFNDTIPAFRREVEMLMNTPVDNRQLIKILDIVYPDKALPGEPHYSISKSTRRTRIRHEVINLHNGDPRVAPYANTAWGVLQAFNTHTHHYAQMRGGDSKQARVERQAFNLVSGKTAESDDLVRRAIDKVVGATV